MSSGQLCNIFIGRRYSVTLKTGNLSILIHIPSSRRNDCYVYWFYITEFGEGFCFDDSVDRQYENTNEFNKNGEDKEKER